MTDLLKRLRPFSFRGIIMPIVDRQFGFAHDYAKHKFVFRDLELLEGLGRRNGTWRFTIPAREGIVRGPYKDLFSKRLTELLRACLDRSVATLNDPIHGEFPAVCASWAETIDIAGKRDGVDVDVEFVHAPEPGELKVTTPFGLGGSKSDAGSLDRAVTGKLPEVAKHTTFLNPLLQIAGALKLIDLQGAKFAAQVDSYTSSLDTLTDQVDRLGDPTAWPIRRTAQNLKDAVLRAKETAAGLNPLEHTVRAITTLTAVAADLGSTASELLAMNPGLAAAAPDVMPGTVIRFAKKQNTAIKGRVAA